jgi:formate/nitrite transporter
MAFHKPVSIAKFAIESATQKVNANLPVTLMLGFLGGAFISLGYLLDLRVVGDLPARWGSLSNLLGAAVFPVGLILVILTGGELITGNMLSLAMALYAKEITFRHLISNWASVTFSNLAGALFVAFFFGHIVGLTEQEPYLEKTISFAGDKINHSFFQSFLSAIGCNWLVCIAIWLAYGTEDIFGKMLAIWFPILTFVAIGFQQVVANMFIIPAAIFAGHFTWLDFIQNIIPVYLGNIVGGAGFVGFIYFRCFHAVDLEETKIKNAS